MAVMALRTVRDVAVLFMMATLAPLLAVGARELLQLFRRAAVTIGTGIGQPLHRRHPQWRVRVLVAIEAVGLLRPMLLTMTRGALRHQFGIIVFARVVGVENRVAFLAGEAMFAAGVLEVCVLVRMTLAAFRGLQRRRRHRVQPRIHLRQLALGGKSKPWLGKPSQGSNNHQGAKNINNSMKRHHVTSSF